MTDLSNVPALSPTEEELSSTTVAWIQHSERPPCLDKLTIQEVMFCRHYFVTFDEKRAAKRVGLKGQGPELLQNPWVREYLQLLQTEWGNESTLINKRHVEHLLINDFIPMAQGKKRIKKWHPEAGNVEVFETNMAAYARALDMAAKHTGFVKDQAETKGVSININFSDLGIQEPPKVIIDAGQPNREG
jgi:hypothetical protein